jgi:tetratricopeptide (TPR) repeat protein
MTASPKIRLIVPPSPAARLTSWKEIAAYLDRDTRTAQLWEKQEGLPIHRHEHQARASVYAYPEELDQWLEMRRPRNAAESEPIAPVSPQIEGSLQIGRRKWLLASFATLLVAGGAGFFWAYEHHRSPTNTDTLLLGDFDNSTGEPAFTSALRQGLYVALEQSPYFEIVSDNKAAEILEQMGRPADEKLLGPVAVEACLRSHAKIAVTGSISQIGSSYAIGLTAVRCDTGAPILHEQEIAEKEEAVIPALDRVSAQLRSRLGESAKSIQSHQTQLEEASTSSLAALDVYSQAFAVWYRSGEAAAIPLFQRAIDLDENFALAYGNLATAEWNLGKTKEAVAHATKAYQLRGRVSELERLVIESWYEVFVTGNLERAVEIDQEALRIYPRSPRILNDLGSIEINLGHMQKALGYLRQADRLESAGVIKGNIAQALMSMGETDEADRVLKEATGAGESSGFLLELEYQLAFLHGDRQKMQSLVADALKTSSGSFDMQCDQALAEAYFGRYRESDQLLQAAMKADRGQNREDEAFRLAQQALADSLAGNPDAAHKEIRQALALDDKENIRIRAAMIDAESGDTGAALAFATQLDKEYPAGTMAQHYWIPLIRAEVEIRNHRPAQAVATLHAAEPFDLAEPDATTIDLMLPVFQRGQALLAAGDAADAAKQFDELIQHPGLGFYYPIGSLAVLESARAYGQIGDSATARARYNSFLGLWKDADSDLPLLKQARAEYARLTH